MNPFLIIGMIIAWAITFLGFFLAYLDNRTDTKEFCVLLASVSMVVAIVLTLACGIQWQHLHPN